MIPQGKKNNHCQARALLLWAPMIPSAASCTPPPITHHSVLKRPFLLTSPPTDRECLKGRGCILFISASLLGQPRARWITDNATNVCWILINHLKFYIHYWLLTAAQWVAPSRAPYELECVQVFSQEYRHLKARAILWFTHGPSRNFCWVNNHVSPCI